MKGNETFVMDAIASRFFGTPRSGEDPPDAYLSVGNRDIAVEISTLTEYVVAERGAQPRVSDDQSAKRFVRNVGCALGHLVPEDHRIGLTFSCPLLKMRKTEAALNQILSERLASKAVPLEPIETIINGNTFRIHLCRGSGEKVFGIFSHRRSRSDVPLKTKIREIIDRCVAQKAEKCQGIHCRDGIWLVLLNDYPLANAEDYTTALSYSEVSHPFNKIILVGRDSAVDIVWGGD